MSERDQLKTYTREELEGKLLHICSFVAYKLAVEFMELTDPLAKVIRTPEAELENTQRILDMIVLIHPAWDIIEKTNPSYDLMTDWVNANHKQTLIKPCTCEGCNKDAEKH